MDTPGGQVAYRERIHGVTVKLLIIYRTHPKIRSPISIDYGFKTGGGGLIIEYCLENTPTCFVCVCVIVSTYFAIKNDLVNERAFVFSFSSAFLTPRSVTKRCFWTPIVHLKVGDIINIRMVSVNDCTRHFGLY